MKFINIPKFKNYNGEPVTLIQTKTDGHYTEIYKSKDFPEGIVAYGKKQETNLWPKLSKIDHICTAIKSLPFETILQAELHAPMVQATSVPTLLNNADPRLQLTIFAVPKFNGQPGGQLSWFNAVAAIRQFSLILNVATTVKSTVRAEIAVAEHWLDFAVKNNIEGLVLKKSHLGQWYKLKPVKTVDCIVMGHTISDSIQHLGGLKAIQVGVYTEGKLQEIASVGSGFLAKYRQEVNLKTLIGRVCEIKYDSLAANGKLKFPRFIRWRDQEKLAENCTAEQLV